ncbi:MAG: hypothetical protein ABIQ99_18735 [Thermoflexales bacterium]
MSTIAASRETFLFTFATARDVLASRAGWADLVWMQSGVRARWTAGEAAWADYLEALLKRRHEHDIELADAPRRLNVDEFDIELDG